MSVQTYDGLTVEIDHRLRELYETRDAVLAERQRLLPQLAALDVAMAALTARQDQLSAEIATYRRDHGYPAHDDGEETPHAAADPAPGSPRRADRDQPSILGRHARDRTVLGGDGSGPITDA